MKAVLYLHIKHFIKIFWSCSISWKSVDLLIGMKYKEGVILMVTPTMLTCLTTLNCAFLTMIEDHQVEPLMQKLRELDKTAPLQGLRAFVLPCLEML